jgi:hypothetical protein
MTRGMIGGALGLALLAGLAAAQAASLASIGVPQLEAINDGYHAAFILGAALSLVTAVLAATQLRDPRPQPPPDVEFSDEDERELVGVGD